MHLKSSQKINVLIPLTLLFAKDNIQRVGLISEEKMIEHCFLKDHFLVTDFSFLFNKVI